MTHEDVLRLGAQLFERATALQKATKSCSKCGEMLCERHSRMLNDIDTEFERLQAESPELPLGVLN
jgi:transcription initiation factor IIE alpha subunit